jgi:hypothetical protein
MKSAKIIFVPLAGILLVLGACSSSPASNSTGSPAPAVTNITPATPAASVATQPVPPAGNPNNATPPPTATLVPVQPPTKQGDFVVSNLTVTPNTIRLFNSANVSVTVKNNGTTPGTYTAVLSVKTATNAQPVTIVPLSQTVTLAPGESQTVSFSVEVRGNGTHIISIEGLYERLSVDSQI